MEASKRAVKDTRKKRMYLQCLSPLPCYSSIHCHHYLRHIYRSTLLLLMSNHYLYFLNRQQEKIFQLLLKCQCYFRNSCSSNSGNCLLNDSSSQNNSRQKFRFSYMVYKVNKNIVLLFDGE